MAGILSRLLLAGILLFGLTFARGAGLAPTPWSTSKINAATNAAHERQLLGIGGGATNPIGANLGAGTNLTIFKRLVITNDGGASVTISNGTFVVRDSAGGVNAQILADGGWDLANGTLFGNANGSFGQQGANNFFVDTLGRVRVEWITNMNATPNALQYHDANRAERSATIGLGLSFSGGALAVVPTNFPISSETRVISLTPPTNNNPNWYGPWRGGMSLTNPLQAAIDSFPSMADTPHGYAVVGGGEIYVMPGVHRVSGPVRDRVTTTGGSKQIRIRGMGALYSIISITNWGGTNKFFHMGTTDALRFTNSGNFITHDVGWISEVNDTNTILYFESGMHHVGIYDCWFGYSGAMSNNVYNGHTYAVPFMTNMPGLVAIALPQTLNESSYVLRNHFAGVACGVDIRCDHSFVNHNVFSAGRTVTGNHTLWPSNSIYHLGAQVISSAGQYRRDVEFNYFAFVSVGIMNIGATDLHTRGNRFEEATVSIATDDSDAGFALISEDEEVIISKITGPPYFIPGTSASYFVQSYWTLSGSGNGTYDRIFRLGKGANGPGNYEFKFTADGKAVFPSTAQGGTLFAGVTAANLSLSSNYPYAALVATMPTFSTNLFVSTNINIPANGDVLFNAPHGLGVQPTTVRLVWLNVTNEVGFVVGDEIDSDSVHNLNGAPFAFGANATNVWARAIDPTAGNWLVFNRTSGALESIGSYSNWKLKMIARP